MYGKKNLSKLQYYLNIPGTKLLNKFQCFNCKCQEFWRGNFWLPSAWGP